MRSNEIYQKSRKEKEKLYKKYKNFDDLFAEIIQSEVKYYGSIKKIPFDVMVETSKIGYEYIWITNEGYGAKNFKGSVVNAFKGICTLSEFDYLKDVEQYKELIELNSEMTKEPFESAEFKYIYSYFLKKVFAEGKFKNFWEEKSFKYTLVKIKEISRSYREVLFMDDTVKYLRENEFVDFETLFLKVVAITEEKKENKIKVEWRLSKNGEIYAGTLDIPGTLKKIKKGKKLHLYGKEISYKDYLKNSKGKIKVDAYYGFPQHVAKWVKAQILNGKAMNAI